MIRIIEDLSRDWRHLDEQCWHLGVRVADS